MKQPHLKALPTTEPVPLNASESDWFINKATELHQLYGNKISGCYIVLRLHESEGPHSTAVARSWNNYAELIGWLQVRVAELTQKFNG